MAELDARSGRVIYDQGKIIGVIGVKELVRHYVRVCAHYPGATIYIVQDNWPVHFHPDVLAALQPQHFKWPLHLPASWTKSLSE